MRLSLGPFTPIEPLGRGGMGVVWRALHVDTGLPVALKVLRPEARTRVLLEGIRNEVRAVASLDHPHIVGLYDQGLVSDEAAHDSGGRLQAGTPWLAMELCEGGSLASQPPHSWMDLRAILLQLLDALAHAHARNIVHRDLKPGNVLFGGQRPGIKLTDFGMAYLLDRHLSGRSREPFGGGTMAWSSPEQIQRRWADQGPWSDLYSVGVVAWWLIDGRRPFEGSPEEMAEGHLRRALPRLKPRFRAPAGVEDWLHHLLAKPPERRYAFAAEAARGLLALPEVGVRSEPEPSNVTLVSLHHDRDDPDWPSELDPTPIPRNWRAGRSPRTRPEQLGAGLGLHGLRRSPLVGRSHEQDLLWSELSQAYRHRRGRLVVLRGATGTGKSRLATWLLQRVHELAAAEPLWTGHSQRREGSRGGLVELVARHARCVDRRRNEVLGRVTRVLARQGVQDIDEVLTLTELIQPLRREEGLQLDRDARQAAVLRYVGRLARRRPVVLVLDDVQWGLESLLFVERLLEERLPVLVVATVQEEDLADRHAEQVTLARLSRHERVLELALEPLGEEACRQLLRDLGLEPALAARVAERSAGNPLFAVQVVGDQLERGALEPGPQGLRLAPGARIRLPEGLRRMWSSRLRNLLESRPTWRQPLAVAALLGVEVDLVEWGVACRLAGLEPPPELWPELVARRLATAEERRRRFGSAMLREVCEPSPELAPALHRACAQALEALDQPGRRGRHLLLAGEGERGLEPLLEAVVRRVTEGRYPAAEDLLNRYDRACDELELGPEDPRRLVGLLRRAHLVSLQGRLSELEDCTRRLLEHAVPGEDLHRRTLLLESRRLRSTGALDAALQLAREARDGAEGELLARCWYEEALVLGGRGEALAAGVALDTALELAPSAAWAGRAWLSHARMALGEGQTLEASAALDRALEAAPKEPFVTASAELIRARLLKRQGLAQLAEQSLRRAWKGLERIGHHAADEARLELARLLLEEGRSSEARTHLRSCLEGSDQPEVVAGARLGLLVCAADLNHDAPWLEQLKPLLAAPPRSHHGLLPLAARKAAMAGFPERVKQIEALLAR